MSTLRIDEEHPLSLEIASLQAAVARYQHEAHTASVKLQRHSLDTSVAIEHTHALEQENARLRIEVETLRNHPDPTPNSAALQVPELTLALRKLSDKLTFTEAALLTRSTELVHARSDLGRARHEIDATIALAQRASSRAEEYERRERDLERRARAAEEGRRLSDLVVEEYAALVRKLEGRRSKGSSDITSVTLPRPSLADTLAEGRTGLQRLLGEFNGETEQLALELSKLRAENESLRAAVAVERQRSEADRESLAQVLLELDKHRADDSTATKMVARYMKFSQSTTDSLQQAMENMRTRHASTITTMESQIEHLHQSLLSERKQTEKLRDALDQLSEDISREAYGRRREILLRLAFLGREEALAESIRRWIRKARETTNRALSKAAENVAETLHEVFDKVLRDAEELLETLNGQSVDGPADGSVARILAVQVALASLTRELQDETHRRLAAQRMLAQVGLAEEQMTVQPEPPLTPPHSTSSLNLSHSSETVQDAVQDKPESPVSVPSITEQNQASFTADQSLRGEDTPIAETAPPQPSESTFRPVHAESSASSAHTQPVDIPQVNDTLSQPLDARGSALEPNHTVIDSSANGKIASVTTVSSSMDFPSPSPSPNLRLGDVGFTSTGTVTSVYGSEEAAPHPLPGTGEVTSQGNHPVQQGTELLHQPIPTIPIVQIAIQEALDERQELPYLSALGIELPQDDADPVLPSVKSLAPSPLLEAPSTPPGMLFSTPKPPTAPPSPPVHPLLADLNATKHRYDDFQKAFRGCDLALKALTKDANALPAALDLAAVIRTAVERLTDVNEDTRVELEIRVADEERMITGYETLLSVPGALTAEDVDEHALTREITDFVAGTGASVARASQQFTRKLDDLQHDIACLKRALHELTSSPQPVAPVTPTSQGWSSWLGSRPVSPAPTFGSVMTTPRARQSSFGSFMHRPSLPNLHSPSNGTPTERDNPFASLGLRISMPALMLSQAGGSAKGLFLSPSLSAGTTRPGRPRTASSTMYMLGLGARGNSGYGFSVPVAKSPPARLTSGDEESHEGAGTAGMDSDVE